MRNLLRRGRPRVCHHLPPHAVECPDPAYVQPGDRDQATGLRVAPLTPAEWREAERAQAAEAIEAAWADYRRNLGGGHRAQAA